LEQDKPDRAKKKIVVQKIAAPSEKTGEWKKQKK